MKFWLILDEISDFIPIINQLNYTDTLKVELRI